MAPTRDNWGFETNNDRIPYGETTLLTDPTTIALADIEGKNGVIVTTTAAPAGVFTLPVLTGDTTAGQFLTIINNDTSTDDIEVNGQEIAIGQSFRFEWDGDAWTTGGGGSGLGVEVVADLAARTTLEGGLGAGDEGKLIYQQDTDVLYSWDGTQSIPVGSVSSIKIDSNAGVITETLDASGNNGLIKYFVNIDVTNTATLAVQAGETLNGATDGTFLFSNYAAGTQFRADEVTGGWVVSVVGASTQSDLTYGELRLDAGFTPAAGFLIGGTWSQTTDSLPQTIEQPGAAPRFILKAGKTYRLEGQGEVTGMSANEYCTFQWRDETNGVYIGARSATVFFNGAAGTSSQSPVTPATAVIKPATDITVALWTPSATGTMTVGGGTTNRTYCRAVELPTTESVLAGMVTPESLSRFIMRPDSESNIIQTSGDQLLLTTTNHTIAYDNNSIQSGDTLVIPKTGQYDLNFSVSQRGLAATWAELNIWVEVNGVEDVRASERNFINAGNWGYNDPDITTVLDVTAGDVLTFHYSTEGQTGTVHDLRISMSQLPTSTVVMPDALEVEDISTQGLFDNLVAAIFDGYEFRMNQANQQAQVRVSTGTKTITGFSAYHTNNAEGTTNRDITLDTNWVNVWDDGTLNMLNIGDYERMVWNDGTSNYEARIILGDGYNANFIEIKRLGQKTVINTTDTPVNDQAASGYMDIGTMRKQWGYTQVAGANTTRTTVTFPQPFQGVPTNIQASLRWNFNATSNNALTQRNIVVDGVPTSTTANFRGIGTNVLDGFYWEAIGLKP